MCVGGGGGGGGHNQHSGTQSFMKIINAFNDDLKNMLTYCGINMHAYNKRAIMAL